MSKKVLLCTATGVADLGVCKSKIEEFYRTYPHASCLNVLARQNGNVIFRAFADEDPVTDGTKKILLIGGLSDRETTEDIEAFYKECEDENFAPSKVIAVDSSFGMIYLAFADKRPDDVSVTDDENKTDEDEDDIFPFLN